MAEEEKKAIEDLKDFKSIKILYGNTFVMFLEQLIKYQESANTVLNLIDKLQQENSEKDKIIYELARSNVELKSYEIKEEYINNTISFFTKYAKNLERNPHWRKENK